MSIRAFYQDEVRETGLCARPFSKYTRLSADGPAPGGGERRRLVPYNFQTAEMLRNGGDPGIHAEGISLDLNDSVRAQPFTIYKCLQFGRQNSPADHNCVSHQLTCLVPAAFRDCRVVVQGDANPCGLAHYG